MRATLSDVLTTLKGRAVSTLATFGTALDIQGRPELDQRLGDLDVVAARSPV